MVQIVSFTGSLTDSSKHGVTTVVLRNVVDELHDDDSLADTRTTEETNFTSLGVRSKQVHDLDTSDQDLLGLSLLSEKRSRSVDWSLGLGLDRSLLIDRLANNVQNAAKSFWTDRHLNSHRISANNSPAHEKNILP